MTAAECPNCRCRDMGGAGVYEPAQADQWCRSETCRYRHWTSGSVPTHKIGHDCPTEQGREIEASTPPTEPTAYGYVGTILSKYGTTHHVYRYHADNYEYAYSLVGLAAGGEARGLSWGVVLQAGKFTAVTS